MPGMSNYCHKCGKAVIISANAQVGRREACQHCNSDLHCCMNCRHFDRSAYNDCREPQAERVLDKDRSNFCDYFVFLEGLRAAADSGKSAALKKLDELFK